MADTAMMSPERTARRAEIARLTQRGTELYSALQSNAAKRDALIVAEMAEGAIARELAEITGLSVGRIYRLRDNGLSRE